MKLEDETDAKLAWLLQGVLTMTKTAENDSPPLRILVVCYLKVVVNQKEHCLLPGQFVFVAWTELFSFFASSYKRSTWTDGSEAKIIQYREDPLEVNLRNREYKNLS